MCSSCVSKLCVWGGRAREEAGVHNQKQEPHTKMGKKGMKIVDIWYMTFDSRQAAIIHHHLCERELNHTHMGYSVK